MKQLFTYVLTFLLIAVTGCGEDSSTGPSVPPETKVEITGMVPASPATLKYYQTSIADDRITISYNYTVTESDGARIWIQIANEPTGADIFYYSPSSVYTGSGSKTVLVSAASDKDTIHVSQLEILIKNSTQTDTISQSFIDVNYTFTK